MPNRHEPYMRDFNFKYFDVFGLTDFETIISVQDDPRLKDNLISVRDSICGAILALEDSLTDEIQDRHSVQVATDEELVELEASFQKSINRTSVICMEFQEKLAKHLDELYVSDKTAIETKDGLYEIRQLVRSFEFNQIMIELTSLLYDIRATREKLNKRLKAN